MKKRKKMNMNNKVLIKLLIPEIDESFDIFIPINEILWKVKKMIVKSAGDLILKSLDTNKNYILINKNTLEIYPNNIQIAKTDIENGTEIILLSVN